MNVLLVRPFHGAGKIIPPLSLGYLATALRPWHRVEICDGLLRPNTPAEFGRRLEAGGYGAVCFSVTQRDVEDVRRSARIARQILPTTRILVGGAQVSVAPGAVMDAVPAADYGFVGETEHVLPGFLEALERGSEEAAVGSTPGLVWRGAGGVVVQPPGFPPNLDDLRVAWDLIPPAAYPPVRLGNRVSRVPAAPILTSRGCPQPCRFCDGHRVSGRTVRRRSLTAVLAEVGELIERFGVREIHVMDDGFTADRDYVLGFSRAIRARYPELRWACPSGVRLETLDRRVLGEMRKAGCVYVSVGVDSTLAPSVPDASRYGRIRAGVRRVRQAGIAVGGFFLLGLPEEGPDEVRAKRALAAEPAFSQVEFHRWPPAGEEGGASGTAVPCDKLWRSTGAAHDLSCRP